MKPYVRELQEERKRSMARMNRQRTMAQMDRDDSSVTLEVVIQSEFVEAFADKVAALLVERLEIPTRKNLWGPGTASPAEVAKMLGGDYTPRSVVELCNQDRLRYHRKSGAKRSPYRVHLDSVNEFLGGE